MHAHKEWLYYAESDLVAAKASLKADDVRIGPILYLSQQCTEKAFKAYLLYKSQRVKKIHDLTELITDCIKLDPEFSQFLEAAAELNPYVTKTRYPDSSFVMPDISVAQYSVKQAEEILKFVESKIW